MAISQRFYIGQLGGKGLQTNLKPFAIPDDAFSELFNALVFRGRVKKRFGSYYLVSTQGGTQLQNAMQSRFKVNLGVLNGSGALTVYVPAVFSSPNYKPIVTPAIGQAFSVGNQFFTVIGLGATNATTITTVGSPLTATLTWNVTTGGANSGKVTITGGNIGDTVYYYPALPVMGLITRETPSISDEQTIGFDTSFAYQFLENGWEVSLAVANVTYWTGNSTQLFWGYNWRGILPDDIYLFVTNNNYQLPSVNTYDPIRYFDNTGTWNNLSPILTAIAPSGSNTSRLATALLAIPFQGRLLFLNVTENAQGIQFSSSNTNVDTGNFDETVAPPPAYAIGQMFIAGNAIYTITSIAAGAQPLAVQWINGVPNAPTATFNATTGELVITGNGQNRNVPVYFFDNVTNDLINYNNRVIWSQRGNPLLTNSFLQWPGLGNFSDAPTKEAIITAEFLKNRLIVGFENSTWELAYTNDETDPFVWQQINTELGCQSTFSQIPFDKNILYIGNVGVHACTGNNVERIDQKIPDEVFNIHNSHGSLGRVCGIRDYYKELVYWSVPYSPRSQDFPFNDRIFVYNYQNDTWAYNNDSITCFGYIQNNVSDDMTGVTWDSLEVTWDDEITWGSASIIQRFRRVVAGNQEGYTFILNADTVVNCSALQITNISTSGATTQQIVIINHNLNQDSIIRLNNIAGITGLTTDAIYKIYTIVDQNTIILLGDDGISPTTFTGTYVGGGTLELITPVNFKTKEFNFYADQGRNTFISKVDFLVERTGSGQVTVDYFISSSVNSVLPGAKSTGALVGTNVLETSAYTLVPRELFQTRLWHPVYFQADGEYVQFYFYLSNDQAMTADIVDSPFELHAMVVHAQPSSNYLR